MGQGVNALNQLGNVAFNANQGWLNALGAPQQAGQGQNGGMDTTQLKNQIDQMLQGMDQNNPVAQLLKQLEGMLTGQNGGGQQDQGAQGAGAPDAGAQGAQGAGAQGGYQGGGPIDNNGNQAGLGDDNKDKGGTVNALGDKVGQEVKNGTTATTKGGFQVGRSADGHTVTIGDPAQKDGPPGDTKTGSDIPDKKYSSSGDPHENGIQGGESTWTSKDREMVLPDGSVVYQEATAKNGLINGVETFKNMKDAEAAGMPTDNLAIYHQGQNGGKASLEAVTDGDKNTKLTAEQQKKLEDMGGPADPNGANGVQPVEGANGGQQAQGANGVQPAQGADGGQQAQGGGANGGQQPQGAQGLGGGPQGQDAQGGGKDQQLLQLLQEIIQAIAGMGGGGGAQQQHHAQVA